MISVTQALSELKLVRKRIDNVVDGVEFTTLKKANDMLDVTKFSAKATAAHQSFTDLLARYNALKAAIVKSNATTQVTIAGTTYTIAEAVERKRTIQFERDLLTRFQHQFTSVKEDFEAHQRNEQARVERLLTTELAKDAKTNVEVIQQLTATFLAQNKATIVDPLNLADLIRTMTESIENFETKVDYILSESNGRTMLSL
jgi:hypothetical protein